MGEAEGEIGEGYKATQERCAPPESLGFQTCRALGSLPRVMRLQGQYQRHALSIPILKSMQ